MIEFDPDCKKKKKNIFANFYENRYYRLSYGNIKFVTHGRKQRIPYKKKNIYIVMISVTGCADIFMPLCLSVHKKKVVPIYERFVYKILNKTANMYIYFVYIYCILLINL